MFNWMHEAWRWIADLPIWSRSFYDAKFWDDFFDGMYAHTLLFMPPEPSKVEPVTEESIWAELEEAWFDAVEQFAVEYPDVFTRVLAQRQHTQALAS